MAEHDQQGGGEQKGWVPTFVLSVVLFGVLYVFTLWFGHILVEPH